MTNFHFFQDLVSGQVPPIVSVDIPSGWNVDEELAPEHGIQPDMLISLTAPKLAAKGFQVGHEIAKTQKLT
jgi:NAD(P)H-hydrate epimerase